MNAISLTMASNGRVVIPASMRAELGLRDGEKLVARVENGAVVLEPVSVALTRAQALVAKYIPDGRGIVDEFIAERHAAAERGD